MTTFVLAQISITDRDTYNRYASRFLPTLQPFGGQLLAADENPMPVLGSWPFEKAVLIAFEDRERAVGWMRSPEYTAISADRDASTVGTVLIIDGLPKATI